MNHFGKNIIAVYGDRGEKWLGILPEKIAKVADKYDLSQLMPVANMSFNYVMSGYQKVKPIILKVGLDDKALAKEAQCLKAFSRNGCVEVVASDEGVLISERALPGSTLKHYFPDREGEAINILCSVIKTLHLVEIPKNLQFDHLNDLLKTLDLELAIPNDILSKAKRLRDELLSSRQKTVLLHGDLHHENILQNGNEWLAIDPKGYIGDPVFDVCAFINNPMPELLNSSNPREIINNRIVRCAKLLGFSEQRIRDWHYVQTVLCWAWQLEDNLDSDYFKKLIETMK